MDKNCSAITIRPITLEHDFAELKSFLGDKDAQRLEFCCAAVDGGDTFILVADHCGRGVGLAVVDMRYRADMDANSDSKGSKYPEEENAYLENIEIRRGLRNQGIGSKLLHAVEQEARRRGKHQLWLHTDEDNSSAHRFYERNGWVHTRTVYPTWKAGKRTRVYSKMLSARDLPEWQSPTLTSNGRS